MKIKLKYKKVPASSPVGVDNGYLLGTESQAKDFLKHPGNYVQISCVESTRSWMMSFARDPKSTAGPRDYWLVYLNPEPKSNEWGEVGL
jgi:hypothetical protein